MKDNVQRYSNVEYNIKLFEWALILLSEEHNTVNTIH